MFMSDLNRRSVNEKSFEERVTVKKSGSRERRVGALQRHCCQMTRNSSEQIPQTE